MRYLLKALLLPPMFQFLLLLLAFFIRKKVAKLAGFICLMALGSLWALSTPAISNYLSGMLQEDRAIPPDKLKTIKADAIVVLSASQNHFAPEYGEPVSKGMQLMRVRYGAFVHNLTGAPVLVTGSRLQFIKGHSNAETMARELKKSYNVIPDWIEKKSRTTAESAAFSYKILEPLGKTNVLLVTSAFHMKRAKYLFEKAGFSVIAAPTDLIRDRPLTITSFIPTASGLKRSRQAIHEWLGLGYYYVRM